MIVRYAEGLVGFEIDDDSPLGRLVQYGQLVREARESVARYPQYDGKFDDDKGWRLAVALRDVETKGGLRFAEGEVFIAQVKDDRDDDFYGRTFGWSRRGAISCLLLDGDFRFLKGDQR